MLRFITMSAVLPDPVPLIDGFIELGAVGLLYARWGCYKTFLALDWGLHIANGLPWLGHEVEQGTVFVLGYEAPRSIHRRAQAWGRYYGKTTEALKFEMKPLAPLSNHEVMRAYSLALDELDARFVIVDTLARGSGGLDSNSPEIGKAYEGLHILSGPQRSVVGLAHAGKDPTRGVRGHSSQEDQMDFLFRLDRKRAVNGQPKGPATLTNPKQKDGDPASAERFDLSSGQHRIGIKEGDRVLLPLNVANPEPEHDDDEGKAERTVLGFLRAQGGWTTTAEVRRRCKRSRSNRGGGVTAADIDDVLERLIEDEVLLTTAGGDSVQMNPDIEREMS